MTPHTIRSAALSTGLTVPYVEQGRADGVPLVLLHGYTDSWRSWARVLAHLPEDVRALAVTQRGHGDADRPPTGYRPGDLADDVVAFMDAVGIDAAVVVGHSGGSYTAQQLAVDHPRRALGLVLVGAFRSMRDKPVAHALAEAVAQLADPVDVEFVRAFQESTAIRPLPPAFLDDVVAESCKVPARVWRAALRGLLDAEPPTRAGVIVAPTLIVWGDRDHFAPREDQDALVAAIDGARLLVHAGTGHAPHWEQPERVAAEVATFARARAARSGAASTAV